MNLNDVVRHVQRIFGDEYEVQIKTEDIVDWANESIVTIARETEFKTGTLGPVPYGPSTDGVALPTQFIGEKRVTWDSVPLDRAEINQLDDMTTVETTGVLGARPTHFYFWDEKIYLHPTPGQAANLVMNYVATPSTHTEMSAPLPLPLHHHWTVIRMCLVRARELNEDFDQAARLQTEVDGLLGKSRDDQNNRFRETFPVVKDDPADWCW